VLSKHISAQRVQSLLLWGGAQQEAGVREASHVFWVAMAPYSVDVWRIGARRI